MKTNTPLPTGWIQMPLGNCGTWHGGGTPSKFNDSYWTNGTIPWISPKDMKTFRITDSEDHLAQLAIEETQVKPFPSGTVLVVIRSGILSRTLPVAVGQVPGTMNQDLKGLLPSEGIDSEFVAYFLQAYEQDILRKCSKHGTTVASIDTASLHSYPLSIAPLNEQRRIVAKIEELFSDLDAGVAALKRAKANLKRYRAAVLKAAVEGKLTEKWRVEAASRRLSSESKTRQDAASTYEPASALLARILKERRQKWEADQLAKFAAAGKEPPKNWRDKYVEPLPPDTSALPELPEGWCWASVDQLIVRSEYGTSVKCDYDGDGPPVLRIPNIAAGEIALTDIKFAVHPLPFGNDDCLRPGDMLMCRTNGSISLIGKAAVVRTELSPPHSFASYLLRFRFGLLASLPSWVHTFVGSFQGRRFIESNAASSAGQHNISLSLIHTMSIPLPPLVEQQQIIEDVSERLSQIDAAEMQIEHGLLRASRLRQSILKQAFEGKLVPQDPSDEPASVLLERLRASQSDHDTKNRAKNNARPAKRKKSERMVDK